MALYVRGYQVYQVVWIPAMGETLKLAVETTNSHNMYAMAVMQDGRDRTVRVVGHVTRNASWVISIILKKTEALASARWLERGLTVVFDSA